MHDASAIYLGNARLATYAIGPEPAWLWSEDGSRALWANAAGAMLFGASTVNELAKRRFAPSDPEMQQVARLAQTLANDGAPRLERLRVFGAGLLLHPLICTCSRLTIGEATPAILICGIEPIRPALSLQDCVQRLLDGNEEALAAFTLAGDLLFATRPAQEMLGQATHIAAIGATEIAAEAVSGGQAAGSGLLGPTTLWRVGRRSDTVLIAQFSQPTLRSSAEEAPQGAIPETLLIPDPAKPAFAEEVPHAIALAKLAQQQRRHPLRFVWEMDAEQHFTLTSDEFMAITGATTAQRNGALWSEICAALGLDPDEQVANAIATHDTWSGIALAWPTAKGDRVKVELAGLPIFDRQRRFTGYRGFGVCRDLAQIGHPGIEPIAEPAPPAIIPSKPTGPAAIMPEPGRPALSLVTPSANIVPFPATPVADQRTPALTAGERKAFSDIAQQLSDRLRSGARVDNVERDAERRVAPDAEQPPFLSHASGIDGRAADAGRLETGSDESNWFAEGSGGRALLDGLPFGILIYRAHRLLFANRAFLEQLGFASLEQFSEKGSLDNLLLSERSSKDARTFSITAGDGERRIEAQLFEAPFGAETVNVLVLAASDVTREGETTAQSRSTIRDRAPDRAVERILEQQIGAVRRQLEQSATQHAAFLVRIDRGLRTPLTAILGFAEAILSERFGPIGNERYRDYLSGIRHAGERILTLLGELESAAQSVPVQEHPGQAVKGDVDLNRIVQTCVAELQPDASRNRVLIRTSLQRPLPAVAADPNAVREIVINLLTNSIKLAGAGGQVIISTGVSGTGTVSLRLRDTGIGVNERDVAAALQAEPLGGQSPGPEGRLKLAVAKALVEANRASLKISSRPDDGTLVEVSFREISAA